MKEVKISAGTSTAIIKIPETWAELSVDQFVFFINHQGNDMKNISNDVLKYMLGDIPYEIEFWLTPIDYYYLGKELNWMLDILKLNITIIRQVELKNIVYYGPHFSFDNVTWEEFMFADTLASMGNWKAVAATLFRPQKKAYDGNSDIRIPFSSDGTNNRMSEFDALPQDLLNAIKVQYIVQRQRMTEKYNRIFFNSQNTESNHKNQLPNWVTLIRTVIFDYWYKEKEIFSSPVNSVLFHLNDMVKRNDKQKMNNQPKYN